jgi:hypothetical protein
MFGNNGEAKAAPAVAANWRRSFLRFIIIGKCVNVTRQGNFHPGCRKMVSGTRLAVVLCASNAHTLMKIPRFHSQRATSSSRVKVMQGLIQAQSFGG